jgi:hypothetical protein
MKRFVRLVSEEPIYYAGLCIGIAYLWVALVWFAVQVIGTLGR